MTEAEIDELMTVIVNTSAVLMNAIQTAGYQDKGNGWSVTLRSVTLPGPGISITLTIDSLAELQEAFKQEVK